MKRAAIVVTMCTSLAFGCAHAQPTNRQIAIGAGIVVGLSVLLYLAITQCDKGANFCDNSPNP